MSNPFDSYSDDDPEIMMPAKVPHPNDRYWDQHRRGANGSSDPRSSSCPICNWPKDEYQALIDDLSDPDNIPPFDQLLVKHRVNAAHLAAHIGFCMNDHLLLYTSQQFAHDRSQSLYQDLIQAMGQSLAKAHQLLDTAAEDTSQDPVRLAKAYTDLHKAQAAAAGVVQQDTEHRQLQARMTLLERRVMANRTQDPSVPSQRRSVADLIDLAQRNGPQPTPNDEDA